MYKINEVSKLTGVSIRMLHHYDKIRLLEPSKRTDSNYRMYNDDDIARLYQILLFKELEFPLQEIKQILDDKDFNRKEALKAQRNLIFKKKQRLERILESIDDTIENLGGETMSKDNFKAFGYEEVKKHQEKYKEETEKRYGNSDAYKESQEKTSKYSKNDWENIMGEASVIYEELAKLRDKDQLKGSYILGLESTSSRMMSIGRALLLNNKVESTDDILKSIDNVDRETVKIVIDKIFNLDKLGVCIVGRDVEENKL